jgi:hypothetical protein
MDDDESDICGCAGRLAQLECPNCHRTRWMTGPDKTTEAIGGPLWPDAGLEQYCPACGRSAPAWVVREQAPKSFLVQPNILHPMTRQDFDYWVGVLRAHFPDHPRLRQEGRVFEPATPDQAKARRDAYVAAHPIVDMRDQEGASRRFPDLRRACEWLEVMRPGDHLTFVHRDGDTLIFDGFARGSLSVRHLDSSGGVVTQRSEVGHKAACVIVWRYLAGDVATCDREIENAPEDGEPAAYPDYVCAVNDRRALWNDGRERLIALLGEPMSTADGGPK